MIRMKRLIWTTVISLGLTTTLTAGQVFFVKPAGNDTNDGLAWAKAKRTITAALAASTYGDEIWVAAGTYTNPMTYADRIVLGGFAGNETAQNQRNWSVNRTIIDTRPSTLISVRMSIGTSFDKTVLDGFEILSSASSAAVEGSQGNGQIRNCIIRPAYRGVYLATSSSSFLVANNLIIGATEAFATGAAYVKFVNNTAVNCTSTTKGAIGIYGGNSVLLLNNIVSDCAGYGLYASGTDFLANIAHSNNIINRCTAGVYRYIMTNASEMVTDPKFVGGSDYSLQAGSPAVDRGAAYDGIPDKDLAGNSRYQGYAVDIGAYESAPAAAAVSGVTLSPVPGDYSGSQSITMTVSTPGAMIRYTLDGSIPTETSALYTNPVVLVTPKTVLARGFAAGYVPGPIAGGDYSIRVQYKVDDSAVGPVHDGLTWATAFNTINEALAVAAQGDEVWVAAGTYAGINRYLCDVALYGGFNGTETAREQRNWFENRSVVTSQLRSAAGQLKYTIIDGFELSAVTCLSHLDEGLQVRNNIIRAGSIGIDMRSGGPMTPTEVVIVNNLFIGGATHIVGTFNNTCIANNSFVGQTNAGSMCLKIQGGNMCRIYNNIFANNAGYGVNRTSLATVIVIDNQNNLFFNNASGNYYSVTASVSDIIGRNPLFTDSARGVYSLQSASSAANAGLDYPEMTGLDLWHQPRLRGTAVDIGAYEIQPTGALTLAEWMHVYFTAAEVLDSAMSGANADPDGDGLSNLAERALGLNPMAPDESGLPTANMEQGNIVMTLKRPSPAPTDITYVAEASSVLSGWTQVSLGTAIPNGDGTETIRIVDTANSGNSPVRFMRLRVFDN